MSIQGMLPAFLSFRVSLDLTSLNLPLIKDTMYHTIRGDNENFLIELK